MNIYFKLFIAYLLISVVGTVLATDKKPVRTKYNFNQEWRLFVGDPTDGAREDFDDSAWKKVTLPHSWNEDDAFRLAINKLPKGIAWYRKSFNVPLAQKGMKVFLEFEGLRQAGTVYVNGKEMILHENGVMAFGIDISDVVRFGEEKNVIAVRTDNASNYKEKATNVGFQWNHSAFYVSYGGINKGVSLHVLPQVYQTLPLYNNLETTGVYVYASEIDVKAGKAQIHAESEVKNESNQPKNINYVVDVRDMDGKLVGKFQGDKITLAPGEQKILHATKELKGLKFWSWGYGYLYDVTTKLMENGSLVDELVTRTGFRKTAFEKGMVVLNDRPIQLKGYAQRSTNEWPAIGSSVPAWLSDYSNQLVIEGNGNFFRWMHVTPSKQEVESCDRVGLIQVLPAGDSEKDVTGRQWEQRKELMRDAIIYNRNNPSVLLYEAGNKRISAAHILEMKAIRDLFDPHGGRAMGSREMLDEKDSEWGGEMLYINHSAAKPMWATEYMRDEGLRKYWDSYSYPYHKHGDGPLYRGEPAPTYNQNQDLMTVENVHRWFDYYEARPGTGERVSAGGAKIIFSDSNTHMRGAENYRRSGVVDAMRIPKDGYYAHQVMWNGWVDLDSIKTHVVGHWNYPSDVVKDVYVVSAAPKVELYVNDQIVSRAEKSSHFLNTFKNVAFKAGKLKAVSYDDKGTVVSTHVLRTVGEPAAIRMKVLTAPNGMLADGHDLALVEFEVVDKDGYRCPLANDTISFALEGPAEWRGGIAQGKNNFILSKTIPVECGVNRVLVRSTALPGKIRLHAKAGALKSATIAWETLPVEVKHGLGTVFQSAQLPSFLGKGPTPSTPSFIASRKAIAVTAVKAGSDEQDGNKSYDDNEMSQWKNDGKMATAWISYTLEREAELSEICAKLSGWRTTSYPLEVFVDGKQVWKGNTPRNLGYTTLRFPPARGRDVLIRMVGKVDQKDGFSNITEVDPTVDLDDFNNSKDPKAKGQLRINEIEFYEAVKSVK